MCVSVVAELILVGLVSGTVSNASVVEFLFYVVWYSPFYTNSIHASHIFS